MRGPVRSGSLFNRHMVPFSTIIVLTTTAGPRFDRQLVPFSIDKHRDTAVAMWRNELKLTCLQVADGSA